MKLKHLGHRGGEKRALEGSEKEDVSQSWRKGEDKHSLIQRKREKEYNN